MLQHFVFGVCKMIDIMVPDVPEALELKIKRERYLAKQALADTDTLMKVQNNTISASHYHAILKRTFRTIDYDRNIF